MIFKNKNFTQLVLLVNNSALASLASYALTIFLANHLGSERFGKYSYVLVLVGLQGILINYATDSIAGAILAKGERKQTVFNLIYTVRIFFFILTTSLIIISTFDWLTKVGVVLLSILNFNLAFLFELRKKNKTYSFIYLMERLTYVLIIFSLLIWSETKLLTIFIIFFLVTALSILYQFKLNKYYLFNYELPKRNDFIGLLKSNSFLIGISLSAFAYGGFSKFFIENNIGMDALGIFSAGMQFVVIITLITAQIHRVYRLPIYKAILNRNTTAFMHFAKQAFFFSVSPALILLITFIFFSEFIIGVLFSEQFKALNDLMPVLGVYFILASVDSIFELFWIGFKKLKEYFLINFCNSCILLITFFYMSSLKIEDFVIVIIIFKSFTIIYSLIRINFLKKMWFINK
ncbi:lipopolysaccharide biosynthesis protein [Aestuariivivens sp. NBU2969]|uniref:lipopolysaccharide biosynthesis protein n=1 Tax=Aestuariivivens sp. NBU2969 TaxID=2873267 RepID=UPI001CBAEFDB|nr:hypothetical protein [Aestuariivivens sp. NBU2969]